MIYTHDMPEKQNPDIKRMTSAQLRRELMQLRHAIRKHRDAQNNARCWHNDLQLYAALPEEQDPGKMIGDEATLLRNCKRYIRRQQCILHGCRRAKP